MSVWRGVPEPEPFRPRGSDWLRIAARGLPMGALVFGGLALLLLVRLVERPLCGMARPVTPWITVGVCRGALAILGLRLVRRGTPLDGQGAMVANHSSWLDIFALNACAPLYFVSKSEVAGWPGIGWLARATGTLFIRRDPREAARQTVIFETRVAMGHRLLFFPEGTSTDGRRVLPFKTTLFQAFFADRLRHLARIQPVSVTYIAPAGERPDLYGWWGEMDFGPNLLQTLALRRHGEVRVILHAPEGVDAFPNRKSLARKLEATVRSGHAPLQV